ncbi:trichohyalin-like isoform X2 [Hylaeus volcanicus]|nr:trichohyalin-like isoform X2 [Hylaeus volcanicus]
MRRSSSRSFSMRVAGHIANEKCNPHNLTVQDTLLSNEKIFQKVARDRLPEGKNNRVEYTDGSVHFNQNVPQDSLTNTHILETYDSFPSVYDSGKENRSTEILLNNDLKSYVRNEFYRQKRRLQNSTKTLPSVNRDTDASHFAVDKGKHDNICSMLNNEKENVDQENMDDCLLDSSPPVSYALEKNALQDYKKKVYSTVKARQDSHKDPEPYHKGSEVIVSKHYTSRGDKNCSILEESLQSRVPVGGYERNEEVEKTSANELIMKTFTEDVSYKSKPGTRRAMSVDLALTRHHGKSNNFRLAKESGKDICVCGASAFWERERIALTTERVRLKQKSDALRSETVYLRETRNRLHSRLLDLENFETDIKSRSELLTAKEAATEAESDRLMRLQAEIKASREEATRLLEEVTLKERNVEVDRRKHEKEVSSLREQESFITSECRRLRELANRLEKKKQEFTTVEDSLQEAKKQLKNIRDELQEKKNALDKQNQELLDVAYNLSEEKKALEQREKALQVESSNLNSLNQDLQEKEKMLREDEKNIRHEREKLDGERDFYEQTLMRIQTEKESLYAEREEFLKQRNKEKEVWFEEVAEEKRKVEEMTNALQDERNFYERESKELQLFQEELSRKQDQMNQQLKVLYEKEESLKQIEKMNRKEARELNEMRLKIEKSQSALSASQKNLKEQQLKTTTQLEILGKEREQIGNEMKAIQQNKIVLENKMKELDEKEGRITQRESVLLSKEARSQWHQDIMKDMNDMKDRYELELQDLELEKRSFAELKADVLAEQERASVALRLREQSLAALEASIRTKHAEILRREKLTSLRGNTDTFLTSSPLRHT